MRIAVLLAESARSVRTLTPLTSSVSEKKLSIMLCWTVSFDRINQKVMANLPKRGKEDFFVSSNRDIAMQVSKKICEKVSKSEKTKLEINAAFDKLL